MTRLFRTLLVPCLGLLLALAGCSTTSTEIVTDPVSTAGGSVGALAPAPPITRLANGEKVRVTVFGEPQLSGEFEIDGAGQVAMPLIGQVPAGGLTTSEIEAGIASRLKGRYLVDPKVNVEITSFRPIYVIGEVKTSGEFPYKSGLNVVSALALAGGYTPRANSTYVFIKRANAAKEEQVAALPSVPVYPGDLIRVPERYF